MRLKFKEEPNEWRKSTLLTLGGLAVIGSLLRWRHHLSIGYWCALLATLAVVAVTAIVQPRYFRGWYRLSLRLGFHLAQFFGRCVLVILFFFVVTPLGWTLRLMRKDPLKLNPPRATSTYWAPAKNRDSLDQLF